MKSAILIFALLAATGAEAQSMSPMWWSAKETHFDWAATKQCAAKPYRVPKADEPGGNNMLSPEWRRYELEFHQITLCRVALAAHHDGWTAATTAPDPYPPEPMMREDDLK